MGLDLGFSRGAHQDPTSLAVSDAWAYGSSFSLPERTTAARSLPAAPQEDEYSRSQDFECLAQRKVGTCWD